MPSDFLVGRVSAQDEDSGPNAEITFNLKTASKNFRIDGPTGECCEGSILVALELITTWRDTSWAMAYINHQTGQFKNISLPEPALNGVEDWPETFYYASNTLLKHSLIRKNGLQETSIISYCPVSCISTTLLLFTPLDQ